MNRLVSWSIKNAMAISFTKLNSFTIFKDVKIIVETLALIVFHCEVRVVIFYLSSAFIAIVIVHLLFVGCFASLKWPVLIPSSVIVDGRTSMNAIALNNTFVTIHNSMPHAKETHYIPNHTNSTLKPHQFYVFLMFKTQMNHFSDTSVTEQMHLLVHLWERI